MEAVIEELIGEKMFELYEHHGSMVWVRSSLKGKHREHCLCHSCSRFHPDDQDANCSLANENFAMCVRNDMVLPVWECPKFIAR